MTLAYGRNSSNPPLPDFASQVAGAGLAEIAGVLGEQSGEEAGPAEVAVTPLGQPGPHFGLDLDLAMYLIQAPRGGGRARQASTPERRR